MTPLGFRYRPCPLPALPPGRGCSQLRHSTRHPGHISRHADTGHVSGRAYPVTPCPRSGQRREPGVQTPRPPRLGTSRIPFQLPCSRTPEAGGTIYIWDIFVRHQCSKSFSVKLLIAFGSPNRKRAPGTFSRGWPRWLLLFKRSSEVQDRDSQGHTSVLPDPSRCLQTGLRAK